MNIFRGDFYLAGIVIVILSFIKHLSQVPCSSIAAAPKVITKVFTNIFIFTRCYFCGLIKCNILKLYYFWFILLCPVLVLTIFLYYAANCIICNRTRVYIFNN